MCTCWAFGEPGPPRSTANAAGEAANPSAVVPSRASTRLDLLVVVLVPPVLGVFILLPLRALDAVVNRRTDAECGLRHPATHHPLG